jgi:DNA-directed RNA polymerase subunit RPC12/RpoP
VKNRQIKNKTGTSLLTIFDKKSIMSTLVTEYNFTCFKKEGHMSFFDDFGKKISQASQTTIQKTKDMAEVAKINSYISDEEKRINNMLLEIGKKYVELHKEEPEEDFVPFLQAIDESEKKIEDYKVQIQNIKGVVRCTNCGAEVPNGAAFCSACGAQIVLPQPEDTAEAEDGEQTESEEESTVRCEKCGQLLPAGTKFCTTCGTEIL